MRRRPPPSLRTGANALLAGIRSGLQGRDLALIAGGLTFYAGIAVVPLLVLSFSLTSHLTSPGRVRELGDRLAELLPGELGAPDAVTRLVDAGVGLTAGQALLALLPMSLYGEGLRRALLRFGRREEALTAWRGRLAALPLLLLAPFVLHPLLLSADVMAGLAERGGAGAAVGRIAVGYYACLAALTLPLVWGFRVVGSGAMRWAALVSGALFTAACLSGFLQGFVLFLSLPLDLGAPFGGLDVVGGVVAIGFWLWVLHLVVLGGWLVTRALDDVMSPRGRPPAAPGDPPGAALPGC